MGVYLGAQRIDSALIVAATATASATLVAGKHTPVDATSGAKTMTLPTTASAGMLISVEKADATTNAVTVTGTLRGGTSSIPLTSQYEARTFLSEGSGSWRPVSDHRTAASLAATFVSRGALMVSVTDFGAKGDGTTDDSAAIQAAVDSMPKGGRLWFPPGAYLMGSTVNITKPIVVEGAARTAANNAVGSVIRVTNGAVTPFSVASDQVTFHEIAFSCTAGVASVTSGQNCAIKFTAGNFCAIERCRISGFWIGAWVEAGYGWFISESYIVNNAKYGLLVRDVGNVDAGDQVLRGCQFDADMTTWVPDAAVRYESGGGMKIQHNKFTHHQIGLDLAIADGAATSVLLVNGNSFENQFTSAIKLARAGTTGTFSRVNISGNQLSCQLCTAAGISIDAGISEVMVTSNIMWGNGTSTQLITLLGGDNIHISDNSLRVALIGINASATAATDVRITSTNKYRGISTPVIDAPLAYANNKGLVEHRQVRNIPFIGSTSAYTSIFTLNMVDRGAIEFELLVTGRIESGISGFAVKHRRIATRLGAGLGAALTTVGTDVNTGPPVDINYDVTTTVGSIIIQIKRNAGDGGVGLGAFAVIEARGAVERVVIL